MKIEFTLEAELTPGEIKEIMEIDEAGSHITSLDAAVVAGILGDLLTSQAELDEEVQGAKKALGLTGPVMSSEEDKSERTTSSEEDEDESYKERPTSSEEDEDAIRAKQQAFLAVLGKLDPNDFDVVMWAMANCCSILFSAMSSEEDKDAIRAKRQALFAVLGKLDSDSFDAVMWAIENCCSVLF